MKKSIFDLNSKEWQKVLIESRKTSYGKVIYNTNKFFLIILMILCAVLFGGLLAGGIVADELSTFEFVMILFTSVIGFLVLMFILVFMLYKEIDTAKKYYEESDK